MRSEILRIIDANLNRTREGLRVCEDIVRFALHGKDHATTIKTIRHRATNLVLRSKKISLPALLSERDIAGDKAKFIDSMPKSAVDISDIFMSNIERVKESLRVLEECFKIVDIKISQDYRKLRFDVYGIEKRVVKKAGLVSCNRQKRS